MKDRMFGVYVAVVENNILDDEAKIEIVLESVSGKTKCRARIAALTAGNGHGCLFLPEKKDQVLVAFEQGLFEHPVIIGALWSRKDAPPDSNGDGNNNLKLIKTRGGNEIRLIDEDGKEKIEIADKTGKNKISIDAENNTITIDSSADVKINASNGKISLAGKEIDIVATGGNTVIKGDKVNIN